MYTAPPAEWFTPALAGHYLGYSERTLQLWRKTGGGPPFVRVGGRSVRYARASLDEWMRSQGEHASTADESVARMAS